MERSISSLTYKGSIPEAIAEAKNQKKLLVVYISGEDTESVNLESTTWIDPKVADSVLRYCILLHTPEGSTDAANFSAIYPQKAVPCITAIGYNGLQVWQSGGFVSAEDLASSLEKAWLSLHIQETTATVLTAALASKKSEPPATGTSVVGSSEQGSSSSTAVPPHSSDKHVQSSDTITLAASNLVKETNTESGVRAASKSSSDDQSGTVGIDFSTSASEGAGEFPSPMMTKKENPVAERSNSSDDLYPATERNIDHQPGAPRRGSQVSSAEADKAGQHKSTEGSDKVKVDASDSNRGFNQSSDVYLNIRLPDGVSLQEKFPVTNTLRMVKDYVDRNQSSGMGSYDLAIPYPRKVFGDEDLNKTLSDLSLVNRQALIVVPRQRSGYSHRGSSSSEEAGSTADADTSNENEWGYFSLIKKVLSYVNPFAYLSGGASTSSSGQESQTGIWEYGPNPALRNNVVATDRPYSPYSPNRSSSTSRSNSKSRQPTTSHFGSNIHTLRHDEDDSRFNDRNAFWNGNSTQYGGGDYNGR